MQSINQIQKIALYTFFFSINFEMLTIVENFSVAKFSGILYIVTILPQIQYFISTKNLKSVLIPITGFFILLTINNLIHINERYNEVINQSFFINLVCFLFLINHVRKDYLILEKGLICFALGTILLTLFFTLGIGTDYIDERVRIFGDNQNEIGLKLAAALIIILLTVVQNRLNWNWRRFLFLIPVPFMLRFLAETGSRVSVISFGLAFICGLVLIKSGSLRNKILILIAGIAIFLIIAGQLMESKILAERLTFSFKTGEIAGREQVWERITPLIKEHIFFGVGKTGYEYYYYSNFGLSYSPHNVIFEILCYTGFSGLLLYLAFLGQTIIRGYRSYTRNGWLLPLLLLSPVMGMILSGQILGAKMGWLIFAYLIGSSAIRYGNKNSAPLSLQIPRRSIDQKAPSLIVHP